MWAAWLERMSKVVILPLADCRRFSEGRHDTPFRDILSAPQTFRSGRCDCRQSDHNETIPCGEERVTNKHMSEEAVRTKIAEMKSAPWRTGSFWCLVASVVGILQYWIYPNKVSTEILSGSLVTFAFSTYMQYTLM